MTTPTTPASPPELCPDCQRPTCSGDNKLFSVEDYACMAETIDRLRLELSKAQGELHEAWEQGRMALRSTQNPFPKPEKNEPSDAE